jgi:hypothetical protein
VRADAERPAQDHLEPADAHPGPRQTLPLPDPARRQVPALGRHHPPRHQARQPARQQQLPAQDLRLRLGARLRGQQEPRHDPGGMLICGLLFLYFILKLLLLLFKLPE